MASRPPQRNLRSLLQAAATDRDNNNSPATAAPSPSMAGGGVAQTPPPVSQSSKMSLRDVVGQVMEQFGTASNAALTHESGAPLELHHETLVCFGDTLSLFSEDSLGFVSADGLVDFNVGIAEFTENNNDSVPQNFRNCVFRVEPASQYSALKRYKRGVDSLGIKEFDYRKWDMQYVPSNGKEDVRQTLIDLQMKMEMEKQQNAAEREIALGNPVAYGQPVQLFHIKSKKYLTVARESAELHKECMRVTLDSVGNSGSHFYIHPVYRMRTEGEKVRVGDQVLLFSKKFNQHLHTGSQRYKRSNQIEINVFYSATRWRLNLVAQFEPNSEKFLNAGDVIRLFHREHEGFLSVNEKNSNKLSAVCLHKAHDPSQEESQSCSFMWAIEMSEPFKGGIFSWNRACRIRHLMTGRYLAARPVTTPSTAVPSATNSPADSPGTPSSRRMSLISRSNTRSSSHLSMNLTLRNKWQLVRSGLSAASENQQLDSNATDLFDSDCLMCQLYITSEISDATLWTLHPPSKNEGYISTDANLRIRHVETNTWLHSMNEREVNTAQILFEEDVFSIETVPQNDVDDLEFVSNLLPSLIKLETQFRNLESIHASNVRAVITTLSDLQTFLVRNANISGDLPTGFRSEFFERTFANIGSDTGGIGVGAIAIPSRQRILREKHVLDVVMEIIRLPFEKGYLNVNLLHSSNPNFELYRPYLRMLQLAYKLIRIACKSNRANVLHVSALRDASHIEFMQSQIASGLGAEETLLELIRDNSDLLDKFSASQITNLLDLLFESVTGTWPNSNRPSSSAIHASDSTGDPMRAEVFLAFLSTLCTCEGKAIPGNQAVVRSKLIDNLEYRRKLLILPTMEISSNETSFELNFYDSSTREFRRIPVSKFFENYPEWRGYFSRSIELMAKLAQDRMHFPKDMFPNPENHPKFWIFLLNCEKIPYDVKIAFVLFLETYLHKEKVKLINHVRIWESIQSDQHQERSMPNLIRAILEFLGNYFSEHLSQKTSEISMNRFTFHLVVLLRELFEMGYITDSQEIKPHLNSIINLLDGKSDDAQSLGGETAHGNRFPKTEGSEIIMRTKVELLKVLSCVADLHINLRITTTLTHFQSISPSGQSSALAPRTEFDTNSLFEKIRLNQETISLSEILLDFLKYNDRALNSEALTFLFRYISPRAEFVQIGLSRIELLVGDSQVESWNLLSAKIPAISTSLSDGAFGEVARGLDEIAGELQKKFVQSQRILRNLGFSKLLLTSLIANKTYNTSDNRSLIKKAYKLLSIFAHKNPENQKLLFSEIFPNVGDRKIFDAILADFRLVFPESIQFMIEVFRENRDLCKMVDEKILRSFVNSISEKGKFPLFLQFLRILVKPDMSVIRPNQTNCTKSLLERENDVILLFNKDEEQFQKRNELLEKLIAQRMETPAQIQLAAEAIQTADKADEEAPENLIMYHAELVELLVSCSEGRNQVTEVKLQSLLSIPDLVHFLVDSRTHTFLRKKYLRFLVEVYLEVESDGQQGKEMLRRNFYDEYFDRWYEFLELVVTDCKHFLDPKSERESWLEIDDKCMELYLEVLAYFFGKLFNRQSSREFRKEHQKILDDLISALERLYLSTVSSSFRLKVVRVATSMEATVASSLLRRFLEKVPENVRQLAAEKQQSESSSQAISQRNLLPGGPQTDIPSSGIASNSEDEKIVLEFEKFVASITPKILSDSEMEIIMLEFQQDSEKGGIIMKQIVRILCEFANGSASESELTFGHGSEPRFTSSPQTRMAVGDITLTLKTLSLIRTLISQETFGPRSGIPQQLQEDIICEHEFEEEILSSHHHLRGVAGLGAVQRIPLHHGEVDTPEQKLKKTQNQLNKCGVSRMIIDLICSGREAVQAGALRLGIMVLSGGNKEVQREIYSYLVGNEAESGKSPIGNVFVATIRDLIRTGIVDIKRHKLETAALGQSNNPDEPDANDKKNEASIIISDEENGTSTVGAVLLHDILRFLQLLCEGHYLPMQNFLRNQQVGTTQALSESESLKSAAHGEANVNLIAECVQCLLALEKHIDHTMIDAAIQLFVTLTEFAQGPCIANQAEICRPKLLRVISLLLSMRDVSSETKPETKRDQVIKMKTQVAELKIQILTTLISLLEGFTVDSAPEIPDNMSQHLNITSLYNERQEISLRLRSPEKEVKQFGREYVDKLEQLGMLYHFLIHTLEDCVATRQLGQEIYYGDKAPLLKNHNLNRQQAARSNTLGFPNAADGTSSSGMGDSKRGGERKKKPKRQQSSLLARWFGKLKDQISKQVVLQQKPEKIQRSEFASQTGSIEIVREGILERIYFRIPKLCGYLTEKTKDKFVKEVDRSNGPSGKIDGLVSETEFFMREMEHQERLRKWKLMALISHNWDLIKQFSFFLALFMNVLVMSTYTKVISTRLSRNIPVPGRPISDLDLTGDYMYIWFELIMYFVGGVQLLVTVFLFVFYLIAFAPMTVVRHWNPGIPWNQRFDQIPRTPQFYVKFCWLLFYDYYFWFLLFYLTVIILALFISPLLYCLHLLEVMVRFPTLFNVIKAISNNAQTLFLTGFLGVIAVYIFSVPLFFFFSDAMVLPDHTESLCNTALNCFIATLQYGIRSNGWWEDLIAPDTRFSRMIFNMLFFFTCIVILMNIIFGVIIDTFDALRQKQQEIDDDIHNRCFICNFEASKFDRKANEGISFQKHIKEDHTMWNYVFFLIYLQKKDRTEFTGTEQYIFEKLSQEDYSFFPIHRSIVLETSDRRLGSSDKTDEPEKKNGPSSQ